jgi:hypothetical protein
MFSHFQAFTYLVGVAKLPFRIPANNANPTAKGTFDIGESSVIQKSETGNQKLETRSQESEDGTQNLEVRKQKKNPRPP